MNPADFGAALALAPKLVAADRGAELALAVGHVPDAVIGDMDSLKEEVAGKIPSDRFHKIDEQASTDFEKCLRNIEAPFILALGVTGGRIDHELATLNALVKQAGRTIILVGERDISFVAPLEMALDLPMGTRVSLFPMGEVTGTSKGLKWPINGLQFSPTAQIGTSNRSVAQSITMTFSNRKMLVILPKRFLTDIVAVLGKPAL